MLLSVCSSLAIGLAAHPLVSAGSEPFVLAAIGVCLILGGSLIRKRKPQPRTQTLRDLNSGVANEVRIAAGGEPNSYPMPPARARASRIVAPSFKGQRWRATEPETDSRLTPR